VRFLYFVYPEEMRRFTAGLGLTSRYWMQTEVHVYAFSVAANVLLSFFPFLIVSLSIARLVFPEPAVLGAVNLALRDYFPDALQQFLVRNLPRQGPMPVISIALLLFTANGVFEPLEVALNRIWGIHTNRSFARNQIVSLGLIFVCGALALVSLMLTALNQQSFYGAAAALPLWLHSRIGGGIALFSLLIFKLAALPLVVLILFLVYRYLPNGRPPLARIVPAAVGVGVMLEVLKYVNALAWPAFQQKLAREYGVFQYSASLILLSFLASMLVLAGAEWAARGHRLDAVAEIPLAERSRR
jgi:membrane protein